MTVAERKANELAELIATHRVIRVEMQAEHAICMAKVDMPEFGIVAGEQFHLFASSYAGYCYIVSDSGCGCKSYEHKHGTCKHSTSASKINAARYFAQEAQRRARYVAEYDPCGLAA